MREKILTFIEKNSRIDLNELAIILGVDEATVMNELESMEKEGIICGYHGGKVDTVLMRISDVFLAFPGMVFAIAVAGVTGGGVINAVVALACISWPKFARIARSQVMTLKQSSFIAAAIHLLAPLPSPAGSVM